MYEKFCFTKEELELLQAAIQSWLLNDFYPQDVELQKELEEKDENVVWLY